MPASWQAWISVMPSGTSCSLPSIMSLGTLAYLPSRRVDLGETRRRRRGRMARVGQRIVQERPETFPVLLEVTGTLIVGRLQIAAMRLKLDAYRRIPLLRRRYFQDLLAGIEERVHIELVFLEQLDAAVDGALLVVEIGKFQRRVGQLRVVYRERVCLTRQFMGIGPAPGPLVLGDLQMRVDQSDDGADSHHHIGERDRI